MADDSNPFSDEIAASNGSLNLASIADAESLLHAAGAGEVLGLLQRLGFWIGTGQRSDQPTKQFDPALAKLTAGQLGDTSGYWQSELSRAVAVLGALSGAERQVKHQLKRARDREAARLLREAASRGEKAPTKAVLDVLVSENTRVVELENQLGVLESVSVALSAARDAIEGYCRVLSRELTRRGDMLRGGIG